ncbi:hypothetical protein C2G38_172453 [Gigaspora rosea]|uniref:Uncharacterized protein n=1 Tax=Gigaspora rosea TaxID=44941 RepID=A0A397UTW2_9GLOM|nr:hypothetical protein C2G38_172453 [Gigaspora rosea]
MINKILTTIFILVIIITEVTAGPTASELFNFGIIEYVAYIIITILLIITVIAFHYSKCEVVINIFGIIFFMYFTTVFPYLFFYLKEGHTLRTIILLSFMCLVLLLTCLSVVIVCFVCDEKEKMAYITIAVIAGLIILAYLIGTELGLLINTVTSIKDYGLKSPFQITIDIAFFVLNGVLIIVCIIIICISLCGKNENNLFRIFCGISLVIILVIFYILVEHFFFFYTFLDQVSSASLLLFWTDMWVLLCSIYYVPHRIKPFFKKTKESKESSDLES